MLNSVEDYFVFRYKEKKRQLMAVVELVEVVVVGTSLL